MRRILATSIAAAIPAVLPVHAVDAISYPVDKPAPPVAGSQYRPAPTRAHSHAKHAHHRSASNPENVTHNVTRGPENDVKVDADDGGGPDAQGAPEHSAPEAAGHGSAGTAAARGEHKSTRNRPSRTAHARSADTRPGTGAESGFADADDSALPPEASAAIKEAQSLQDSAGQAAGGGQGKPDTSAPATGASGANAPSANAPRGSAPQGAAQQGSAPQGAAHQGAAPQGAAHQGAAPQGAAQQGAPRGGGRARPARPVTDENSNHKSNRLAAPQAMPVAYFNAVPGARGARLVLHTTAGTSPQHTVTLQCDPPGGTHPRAAEACADVSRAGGDLAQMPQSKNARACFMIYAPVTVQAQGSWHGQPVKFTKKYPNTCVMRDKTGSVFDF
jgi:hypothetical protein